MTATPETAPARPRFADTLAVYLKPRVLIVLFLGFSAGLPLALSGSTLLVWMREAGVDLGIIGLFALVGTPYTIKFLWAPSVDALDVPVLARLLGRRRGWLVFSQLLLIAAIAFLAFCDPVASPYWVAVGALLVAAASATQDIVIDAFRIESLDESEQAAGMAAYVAAYRIGMLASTAGALFLVSGLEGRLSRHGGAGRHRHRNGAHRDRASEIRHRRDRARRTGAGEPAGASGKGRLRQFCRLPHPRLGDRHPRVRRALQVLRCIRRCHDGALRDRSRFLPRRLRRHRQRCRTRGHLIGGFAGGALARAYPLVTSLWIGAFLQMASNLVFTWQALVGVNLWALTVTIIVENFTGAIGTVIFVAYLSALCNNPLHTATQYALLTALAAVGRTYLSSGAGFLAENVGWVWFFALSALTALPSLVLLVWLQQRGHFAGLVKPTRIVMDD